MTETSPPSRYRVAREELARACRTLAAEGLVIGTAGNVSCRAGDAIAISATGVRLATATADDITIVSPTGEVIEGDLAPTSEIALHLGILAFAPPELVSAVVHTHAPVATAVSLVVDELPVLHYAQLELGGALRVAPFHSFGSDELAHSVGAALDGRLAALMANHGAVALGATVAKAVDNALLTEWLCTLHWRASAMGTPKALDAEQQRSVIEMAQRRGYGSTQKLSPPPSAARDAATAEGAER